MKTWQVAFSASTQSSNCDHNIIYDKSYEASCAKPMQITQAKSTKQASRISASQIAISDESLELQDLVICNAMDGRDAIIAKDGILDTAEYLLLIQTRICV